MLFFTWLTQLPASAMDLDRRFGQEGTTSTAISHYGDTARAVTIDQSGRIVVAGTSINGSNSDFSLARYNRDGSLDHGFGREGIATTMVGREDDMANSVAIQNDGRIVVAGSTASGNAVSIAVVRYLADGREDPDFGLNGIVTIDMSNGSSEACSVHALADGTILLAGTITEATKTNAFAARLQPDGSLDHSFGRDGMAVVAADSATRAEDMAVYQDGAIIITGTAVDRYGMSLLLARLLADGSSDLSFGVNGVSDTNHLFGLTTAGKAVGLEETGEIFVAGNVGLDHGQDIALFRFQADGSFDPSFAYNGMEQYDINGEKDGAYDLTVSPDGITIGGYGTSNGFRDFVIIDHPYAETTGYDGSTSKRIIVDHRDGTGTAITRTSLSPSDDTGYGLARQDDGKLLLVGSSNDDNTSTFAIARYGSYESSAKEAKTIANSGCITTTPVTEITRNSAFTGGTIHRGTSCSSFGERGVVYSIAPYPVVTSGGTDGGGDVSGGDDGSGNAGDIGPVRSNGAPTGVLDSGTTSTTLSLNTDVVAECRYSTFAVDLNFNTMTAMATTNATSHKQSISGLTDGGHYEYSIRCRSTAGITNQKNYNIPFSVNSSSSRMAAPDPTEQQARSYKVLATTADNSTATTDPDPVNTETSGRTADGAGSGNYGTILENLSIGTRYYVRAYGITEDGIIYYGNQLSFETKDACFIATAAYGSLLHPYVAPLRMFRDRYLKTNQTGTYLVKQYYRYSQLIVPAIEQSPSLRVMVRLLLLPAISLSYALLNLEIFIIPFSFMLFFIVVIAAFLTGRKNRSAV